MSHQDTGESGPNDVRRGTIRRHKPGGPAQRHHLRRNRHAIELLVGDGGLVQQAEEVVTAARIVQHNGCRRCMVDQPQPPALQGTEGRIPRQRIVGATSWRSVSVGHGRSTAPRVATVSELSEAWSHAFRLR